MHFILTKLKISINFLILINNTEVCVYVYAYMPFTLDINSSAAQGSFPQTEPSL